MKGRWKTAVGDDTRLGPPEPHPALKTEKVKKHTKNRTTKLHQNKSPDWNLTEQIRMNQENQFTKIFVFVKIQIFKI